MQTVTGTVTKINELPIETEVDLGSPEAGGFRKWGLQQLEPRPGSRREQRGEQDTLAEPWASANTLLLGTAESFGGHRREAWSQSRKEAGYCGDSNPGPGARACHHQCLLLFLLTFSQTKVKSKT